LSGRTDKTGEETATGDVKLGSGGVVSGGVSGGWVRGEDNETLKFDLQD